LADVNVAGHIAYLRALFDTLDLWAFLADKGLVVATFLDLGIAPNVNDRFLWTYCQENGWLLFTDNRNDDCHDSLKATLDECWEEGCLPVVTLFSKARFERDGTYRELVAEHVAEILLRASEGEYRTYPRIYVPLSRR
jgi:hypothetical protein